MEYGDLVGDFGPFWLPGGSLGLLSNFYDICDLFGDILVFSLLSTLALFFGDRAGLLPVGMSESLELCCFSSYSSTDDFISLKG